MNKLKKMVAKNKGQKLLPVDVPLQEGVVSEAGTIFVILRTLDELNAFWSKHRKDLPFAAKGIRYGEYQVFLHEYEWIFAPTKAELIKTICRWEKVGIQCKWYDWATIEPADHEYWFIERDEDREEQRKAGLWNSELENDYQKDCLTRNRNTYRGWWQLSNLPNNISEFDWFSSHSYVEIIDPNLPLEVVERILQEKTFDDWQKEYDGELRCFDTPGVDEEIQYWRNEQQNGMEYYGSKNEVPSSILFH